MNLLVGDAPCVSSHVAAGRCALSWTPKREVGRSSTSGPLPTRPRRPEPIHCAETVAEHGAGVCLSVWGLNSDHRQKQCCLHERATCPFSANSMDHLRNIKCLSLGLIVSALIGPPLPSRSLMRLAVARLPAPAAPPPNCHITHWEWQTFNLLLEFQKWSAVYL